MTIIDADAVIASLERVVEAAGRDYSYPVELRDSAGACMYVVDGEYACIAGKVFGDLGVSALWYADYGVEGEPADVACGVLNRAPELDVAFSRDARQVLVIAQQVQDTDTRRTDANGRLLDGTNTGVDNTWGRALDAAKEEYAILNS